jgi:hypothetical protein
MLNDGKNFVLALNILLIKDSKKVLADSSIVHQLIVTDFFKLTLQQLFKFLELFNRSIIKDWNHVWNKLVKMPCPSHCNKHVACQLSHLCIWGKNSCSLSQETLNNQLMV